MGVAANSAMIALGSVLEDAARTREVIVDRLEVRSVTEHLWPNSCLGAPNAGEVCADVLTPGFVIDLEDGLRYHADHSGGFRCVRNARVDTEIRLRFERDGGLTGKHLEYLANSWTLATAEETELNGLIDETEFFDVKSGIPGHAPDAYTYTIWIAVGRRSHVVMFSEGDPLPGPNFAPMLAWLNARLPQNDGGVVETATL